MAILGGILPLSDLWKDIWRISTNNMKKVLDKADSFIKLEEAIRQAQTGHVNNRESQDIMHSHDLPGSQAGTNNSTQISGGNNTINKNNKNSSRRNSGKKGSLTLSHATKLEGQVGEVYMLHPPHGET
uniref:Uncharacterized protein n=1 Tax=Cannabis sativa TaxID=3483 RepID=A0A803QC67_CANSA